jgi:hypothetical protein
MKAELILVPNCMLLAESFFIPVIHFKALIFVALFGFGMRQVVMWRIMKVVIEEIDVEAKKRGLAAYFLTQEEHMLKMRRKFNGFMFLKKAALSVAILAEIVLIVLNIMRLLPGARYQFIFHPA